MSLFGKNRNHEPEWPKSAKILSAKNAEYQKLITTMWENYGIFVKEYRRDATSDPVYFLSIDTSELSSIQSKKVYERLRGNIKHGSLSIPVINSKGKVTGWSDGLYDSKTEAVSIGLQVYFKVFETSAATKKLDDDNF